MKKILLSLCLLSLTVLLTQCVPTPATQPNANPDKLFRSSPESQGVESAGILKFVESLEKEKLELHSFMLLRHGKVIAEAWSNPYQPDLCHFMFSVSKTFTATAVGFAVAENLISIDDKVVSFFPEYDSVYADNDFAKDLTIKNLLTLTAGKEAYANYRQRDPNWVKSFLGAKQSPENGGKFMYNSYATHMMSAIVEKVSGKSILDYLQPRLFDPLDISGIRSELSPAGIVCGGWGMSASTSDIAKLGQFYLQKGAWNGVQLLPASWVEEAAKAQVSTGSSSSMTSDWGQGYGYQMWNCKNNAYRADGAFGQFIIVMPDQDAVLAITAHVNDGQRVLDLVWKHILPNMFDKALPENREWDDKLTAKLKSLALAKPVENAVKLDAKNILGTYTIEENELSIKSIALKQQGDSCKMIIRTDNGTYNFINGNDAWVYQKTDRNSPHFNDPIRNSLGLSPFTVAGYCGWKDKQNMLLKLLYMEDGSSETFDMLFDSNNVSITVINNVEGSNYAPIQLVGHLNK